MALQSGNEAQMNDDKPLPETPAAKLWAKGSYDFMSAHDLRQIATYVRETAGPALAIELDVELWRLSKESLFALAVRAKRAELNADIVGSLLALATSRGSTIALPALAQALSERLKSPLGEGDNIGGNFAERFELRRTVREVQTRMRQRAMLDQFDNLQKEFAAAGEAVTVAEVWERFRRSGVDGTTHPVIAPRLKSVRHIESGGEEFRVLTAPLPIWQSPVSVEVLANVLGLEFPHLAAVAGDVAEFVAGGSAASLRPILLVGPAAIGKDSIMRRAAELVGRPHGEYDLAGSSDNRILRGTSKGWSTASPSYAVTVCAQSRCANPLIQYSELDRAGGSRRNGQVHETLLSLCEPSTRLKWYDDGLGVEVNLSDVAFTFTSNSIDDTPQPLLTRLRVLHLNRPKPEHVAAILEQARRRYATELKIRIEDLPELRPEAIEKLEVVARAGRFHLRLADRIIRALGDGCSGRPTH
jgi:ATP-dependent Lon protease